MSIRAYMGAGAVLGAVAGGAGTWLFGESVAPQLEAEQRLADQVLSGQHAPDVMVGWQEVVGTPEEVAAALHDHISDVHAGVGILGVALVGGGLALGTVGGRATGNALHRWPQ